MLIKITDITIDDRIRRDYGDIKTFATSLDRHGLLHPLVLDASRRLVCGGRRLAAARHLGWQEIECTFIHDLDPEERKEVELEENLKRKDLTWQEEVLGLQEFMRLRQERLGRAGSGPRTGLNFEGYSHEDASGELGRSRAAISMDLTLAQALVDFPQLAKCKNKTDAFKRFRSLREAGFAHHGASTAPVKRFEAWAAERGEAKTFDTLQDKLQRIRILLLNANVKDALTILDDLIDAT